MTEPDHHPYEALEPDLILAAVEQLGYACEGTLLELNSYENRVFRVGLQDRSPVIVKFYRPGRWSDAAIAEEHAFALELAELEIPMAPPIAGEDGSCLHSHGGFRFAVFPYLPGRPPEPDSLANLEVLGRFLGRIHAVGALRPFRHRPEIDLETFGHEPRRYLLASGWLPNALEDRFETVSAELVSAVARAFERAGPCRRIRLHGDCHIGNILWGEDGPQLVDLDDCRSGPAIQDLWMLLSGERDRREAQLGALLAGYARFHDFDPAELHLVEALRALRLLRFSAWLARRWDDPAFPRAFPWFGDDKFWERQIATLHEQIEAVEEAPLKWHG